MSLHRFVKPYTPKAFSFGFGMAFFLILPLMMPREEFGLFAFLWALQVAKSAFLSVGGSQFLLRELAVRAAASDRGICCKYAARIVFFYPAVLAFLVLLIEIFFLKQVILTFPAGYSQDFAVITTISAYFLNLIGHATSFMRVSGWHGRALLLKEVGAPIAFLLSYSFAGLRYGLFEAFMLFLVTIIGTSMTILGVFFLSTRKRKRLFIAETKSRITLYFWLNAILSSVSGQIDILLGGMLISAEALGNYQIAKRLANLALIPKTISVWMVSVEMSAAAAKPARNALFRALKFSRELMFLPGIGLIVLVAMCFPVAMHVYSIAPGELWECFLALLFASAVGLYFGTNTLAATIFHLERYNVLGRALGIAVFALAILLPLSWSTATVGLLYLASFLLFQSTVWLAVLIHQGIDTSLLPALLKKSDDV